MNLLIVSDRRLAKFLNDSKILPSNWVVKYPFFVTMGFHFENILLAYDSPSAQQRVEFKKWVDECLSLRLDRSKGGSIIWLIE